MPTDVPPLIFWAATTILTLLIAGLIGLPILLAERKKQAKEEIIRIDPMTLEPEELMPSILNQIEQVQMASPGGTEQKEKLQNLIIFLNECTIIMVPLKDDLKRLSQQLSELDSQSDLTVPLSQMKLELNRIAAATPPA